MSGISLPPASSPQAVLWTRDDCAKLEDAGVLSYRYELVGGVINKMRQNMPHADVVMLILEWLLHCFGPQFVVTQATIDVRPEENPTNEPMPDAIVLNRPRGEFRSQPVPDDIRLLIEAADSTVRYDLTTKAGLYARAGIVEYWAVSLPDRTLTVNRDPRDGGYQDVRTYQESETVSPLAAPEQPVTVSRLLPSHSE